MINDLKGYRCSNYIPKEFALQPLGAARRQQKNIYACNFNDPQGYISKDSRTGNGGRLVKFESRARGNDRLVVFHCAGINRPLYGAKGNIRLIFDERLDKQGTARKRALFRDFGGNICRLASKYMFGFSSYNEVRSNPNQRV